MNIGIDANCLIFEHAGVGKYTQNILKNIIENDKKNHFYLYFSFLRYRSKRKKEISKLLPRSKNVTVRIIPIPAAWYEFLTSTSLPITKIIHEPLDVFFAPYASGIPKKGFSKMVVTIHDLVFLRYPEHRGGKLSNYYLKRHQIALKSCDRIIAVSYSTKKDLVGLLKVNPNKIEVIYEAVDERFKVLKSKETSKASRVISRYFDPKIKYILSVGTLEPRKNLARLVSAYSLLPYNLQKEYQLVLIGAKGWNNSSLNKTIEDLNLLDKVIIPGFVSDEDLSYIYNRASVFVYPSLYEGFGLPPLEAMASGVPVITSNKSSLPEVVGKAAILVNPQKEDEIANAIRKILSREKFAKKMIKKGLIQARKFSWEKASKKTLKLIKQVAKK